MHPRHDRHRRSDADQRRRPTDGFRTLSAQRFQRLAEDAVASLPSGLTRHLDGAKLHVHDVPPAGEAGRPNAMFARFEPANRPRGGNGASPHLVLFRRPLEARAASKRDLVELIRETVVHELADQLGIDDDGLEELGWR